MGAGRLFARDMVDVRASDAKPALIRPPATDAVTSCLDRAEVSGVRGVAKVERSSQRDGISESLRHNNQPRSWQAKVGLTAVRVGQTQSNISAPRATETTRSSGNPLQRSAATRKDWATTSHHAHDVSRLVVWQETRTRAHADLVSPDGTLTVTSARTPCNRSPWPLLPKDRRWRCLAFVVSPSLRSTHAGGPSRARPG